MAESIYVRFEKFRMSKMLIGGLLARDPLTLFNGPGASEATRVCLFPSFHRPISLSLRLVGAFDGVKSIHRRSF